MSRLKLFIEKIKGSALIKSGLAVTCAKFVLILSNFLIFYILVRICTPTDFGVWILYTTLIGIFELANVSFISNAIVKYYNDYKGRLMGMFIYNVTLFNLFLTLMVSVLLYISIYFINLAYGSEKLNELLYVGSIIFVITGLTNVVNCLEQGNLRFYGQLIASFIKSVFFISYLLYLFFYNIPYDLLNFVYVNLLGGFIALTVVFIVMYKHLSLTFKYNHLLIKKLAKYGFFTFGIEVIGQISSNIGQLITGALLSPAAAGILNVAMRILSFIEIPMQVISTVLMPKGVITLKEKGMGGIKTLYEKSTALLLVVLLPVLIFFFIFAEEIIYLIAGDNFQEAAVLLRIILVYSIIKPFGRNSGVILNAIGKTRVNFIVVLITTALNLLLNYFLILKTGVIGAPIGTLASTLVGFVFSQYILFKVAEIKLKDIFLEMNNYYQYALNYIKPKPKH